MLAAHAIKLFSAGFCAILVFYCEYKVLKPARYFKPLALLAFTLQLTDLFVVELFPVYANQTFMLQLLATYAFFFWGLQAPFIKTLALNFCITIPTAGLLAVLGTANFVLNRSYSLFDGNTPSDIFRQCIIALIEIGFCFLVLHLTTAKKIWEKIPDFSVVLYVLIDLLGLVFLMPYNSYSEKMLPILPIAIFACVGLILPIIIILFYERKKPLQRIKEMYYQQQRQAEYYANLSETLHEFRLVRHDLSNYLRTYAQLPEDEQQQMGRELKEKLEYANRFEQSGNPYIDAVLYEKGQISKEKGIQLTVKSTLAPDMGIDSLILICVVANLLDNAIEASSAGDEVCFCATYHANLLVICVTNPLSDRAVFPIQKESGFTTKVGCNHGIGLESVRHILQQNGGSISLKRSGNLAVATAALQPLV